jgi:hypothetical protein
MDERQIHRGMHASYHWLTSTEDYSGTLLQVCPEIVVGRYVAVTSADGVCGPVPHPFQDCPLVLELQHVSSSSAADAEHKPFISAPLTNI